MYEKLRKKLNDYFIPKRNKHYSQYVSQNEASSRGIHKGICYGIKGKVHDCDFATNNDEQIPERLIQTIENKTLIQKCTSKVWILQEFLTEAGHIKDISLQMTAMATAPCKQAISKVEEPRGKLKGHKDIQVTPTGDFEMK